MKIPHLSLGAALVGGLALVLSASSAPAPETRPVASSAAETFEVDPVHSSVVFRVRHAGVANFYGLFDEVTGTVVLDPADPSKSSVEVEIDAESVNTGNEKRDQHVRSPDFVSAKEFPTISFRSTKVARKGDGWAVTGDLELHGVTKSLTADAVEVGRGETMLGDYRAGFEARFEIDPRDFKIAFLANEKALGPGMGLIVSLECVRQ
jgi:polyisoprenoid-binding protein YceI